MRVENISPKIINFLLGLDDSDLRQMRSLLAQPGVTEALTQQVESILALRRAERTVTLSKTHEGTSRRRDAVNTARGNLRTPAVKINGGADVRVRGSSSARIKESLSAILENKQVFPSRKDVVDSVNAAFECKFDYSLLHKQSRRDVIRRCWSHLQSYPEGKRLAMIETFFQKYASVALQPDGYRDLFRILTRHE